MEIEFFIFGLLFGYVLGFASIAFGYKRHKFSEEEFRRGKHSLSRIDEER